MGKMGLGCLALVVLLVIIIFLMLTTTYSRFAELKIHLPSADDAAEDLAYNVGGRSVGHFIGMMNVRARNVVATSSLATRST